MDLSESSTEVFNRHPWELSRTQCVLGVFSKYIDRMKKADIVYINAGAGDLYFDRILLKKYVNNHVHAIDIAYEDMKPEDDRIHKYHFLEDVKAENMDYAIMMDSLEYMEDDVDYVKKMTQKIRKGGYFFFTLPAFPILFSDYDVKIKNLRRYSHRTFDKVLDKVPELKKVEAHNFYTSLFAIRFVQKMLHLPIDPHCRFTANWSLAQDNILTKILTTCLNIDFGFNRMLGRIGIRLPGLSMIIVCRKV